MVICPLRQQTWSREIPFVEVHIIIIIIVIIIIIQLRTAIYRINEKTHFIVLKLRTTFCNGRGRTGKTGASFTCEV
jgi:hypothetical protein